MSRARHLVFLALGATACGEEEPTAKGPEDTGCDRPELLYFDADGDGYGVESLALEACGGPPGYVSVPGDCDDISPAIHPGAEELCNALDDDCDGLIDPEGTPGLIWSFADADGDERGGEGTGAWTCDLDGRVETEDDCNDSEPLAWTGAEEICGDGVDNDCDGLPGTCVLTETGGFRALGLPIVDSDRGKAELGTSVLSVDLTGDGQADLVSGAPTWSDAALGNRGAVDIQPGPVAWGPHFSGDAHLIHANDTTTAFGTALAAPGDVNGDGYDELLVGAPGALTPAGGSGMLFTVFGPVTSVIQPATGRGHHLQAGTAEVGRRLAVADFQGDGSPDILVNAVRASDRSEVAVLIPDGTAALNQSSLFTEFTGAVFLGAQDPSVAVGTALASLGDIDGDGIPDFGVGSPGWTDTGVRGAVGIFLGMPEEDTDLSTADLFILGEEEQECGHAIAAGDIDGDGSTDLSIACGKGTVDQTGNGGLLVFRSPADGVLSAADAHAVVREDNAGEVLATSISMADMDGDGLADVAANRHGVSSNRSALLMWSGPTLDGTLSHNDSDRLWVDDEGASDKGVVRFGADLTGDAAPDLISGWPEWTGGTKAGQVVVVPGTPGI